MGICQWIMLVLALLSLGIAMEKHGQPKTGCYNFWTYLISWGLQLGLLFFGGFFS